MVQTTDATTTPGWTMTTASSCPHIMPCGVCRLLMMTCPKQIVNYTPTWQQPVSPTCVNESGGE